MFKDMKQVIKVKVITSGCEPAFNEKGDWIDLRAAKDVTIDCPYANTLHKNKTVRNVEFGRELIPLGVAMQLPEGMEAVVVPRSSTCKHFNVLQANSFGVIDNSYCGSDDQWFFPAIAIDTANIRKGDRICQFKIQPSQKATFWQKLKWLLSDGVVIEFVESLENPNRGGHGSTGVK